MQLEGGGGGPRCPSCRHRIGPSTRFCGRCGAVITPATRPDLDEHDPAEPPASDAVPPASDVSSSVSGTRSVSRRMLLTGLGGLAAGGILGAALTRRLTAKPPTGDDGLPLAELEVGDVRQALTTVQADGPLILPDENGRVAIVGWTPSLTTERGSALDRYGSLGENHPVLDTSTGLMALSLIDPRQGCRVHFCDSSGWFGDPCHGSHWNRWGEWTGGPSPRGLDRFHSRVRDDGMLVVELTGHITGPAREDGVLDQEPQGPHCVGG